MVERATAELKVAAARKIDAVKAQLSKRSKVEMERDTLEAGAKYNMLIHTSRTAENLKHRAVAYPTKSRAYPKPEGW